MKMKRALLMAVAATCLAGHVMPVPAQTGRSTLDVAASVGAIPIIGPIGVPHFAPVVPGWEEALGGITLDVALPSSTHYAPFVHVLARQGITLKEMQSLPLSQRQSWSSRAVRHVRGEANPFTRRLLADLDARRSQLFKIPRRAIAGELRALQETYGPFLEDGLAARLRSVALEVQGGRTHRVLESVQSLAALFGFHRRDSAPMFAGHAMWDDDAVPMIDIARFGQDLRRRNIDPRATHVPEFALLAPQHVEYARKAISAQNTDLQQRLVILDKFEEEALERARDKQVTYEWWNDFNFRLTILMTPGHERTYIQDFAFLKRLLQSGAWQSPSAFRKLADRHRRVTKEVYMGRQVAQSFPRPVVIPLLDGDIPIEEMNALYGLQVGVRGVIGKPISEGSFTQWPDYFYRHDDGHIASAHDAVQKFPLSPEMYGDLRTDYHAYRVGLTEPARQAFEYGYLIVTQEYPFLNRYFFSSRLVRSSMREQISQYVHAVLPSGRSKEEEERFVVMIGDELEKFAQWRESKSPGR